MFVPFAPSTLSDRRRKKSFRKHPLLLPDLQGKNEIKEEHQDIFILGLAKAQKLLEISRTFLVKKYGKLQIDRKIWVFSISCTFFGL